MNVEQTIESLRRESSRPVHGFVYDVLRGHAQALDMSEHRRMVLKRSVALASTSSISVASPCCGHRPLSDLPVAFALVAANDQATLDAFLRNLRIGA